MYFFVPLLGRLTIDNPPPSRGTTVPTPQKGSLCSRALSKLLTYDPTEPHANVIFCLPGILWQPSICVRSCHILPTVRVTTHRRFLHPATSPASPSRSFPILPHTFDLSEVPLKRLSCDFPPERILESFSASAPLVVSLHPIQQALFPLVSSYLSPLITFASYLEAAGKEDGTGHHTVITLSRLTLPSARKSVGDPMTPSVLRRSPLSSSTRNSDRYGSTRKLGCARISKGNGGCRHKTWWTC